MTFLRCIRDIFIPPLHYRISYEYNEFDDVVIKKTTHCFRSHKRNHTVTKYITDNNDEIFIKIKNKHMIDKNKYTPVDYVNMDACNDTSIIIHKTVDL
jgi:hypothetical protein